MRERIRNWVIRQLTWLPTIQPLTIVPTDGSGLRFKRYSLTQQGWIAGMFPRFSLIELKSADVGEKIRNTLKTFKEQLLRAGESVQKDLKEAMRKSIANRAGRARNNVEAKINEIVVGAKDAPSTIVASSRQSIQIVHREMLESAKKIAIQEFEKVISKRTAQLLGYARDEAGAGGSNVRKALPAGTRFVFHGDPLTLYIIEEAPRIRHVLWDGTVYKLSFPYVVFAVYLENGNYYFARGFFRNEPLGNVDDQLYYMALPNVSHERDNKENGHRICDLCLGKEALAQIKKGEPSEIIASVQDAFWNTDFQSSHWPINVALARDKIQFTPKKWVELSNQNPQSILKTPWLKSPFTVSELGNKIKVEADAFNMQESMSRLEAYGKELSQKVGQSVQELLLANLSREESVKVARKAFEDSISAEVEKLDLHGKAAEFLKTELFDALDDESLKGFVSIAHEKISAQLEDIGTPITTKITEAFASELITLQKQT